MIDTLERPPLVHTAPPPKAPRSRLEALASGERAYIEPMPPEEARRRLERLAGVVSNAAHVAVGN